MDVSQVGMLNNLSLDVRRKRKIPYKKCKGRFTQKSLGVLNKSIIKGINNSKSFNESNLNRSQLVPLKDINSFLKKNKELALALEESRCAAKNFQKEAFKFQLELIEVRKSLSISHYALLKCSCQKDIGFSLNVDLLTHIKNSLEQTKQTLEKYVSTVILNKIKGVNTHKDGVNSSTQTEKIHMKNKRLQAHSSAHLSAYTERYRKENVSCVCSVVDKKKDIGLIDKETQKDFDVSIIEDRMKHLKNITYELKELSVGELKNTINDKAIKNEILKNKNVQSNFQSSRDLFQNNKKENERMPLSVIYDANITSKDSVSKKGDSPKGEKGNRKCRQVDPLLRSLQEQKKVPAFQLYEDNPTGSNKENFQQIGIHSSDGKEKDRHERRVRILSPPQIRFFNRSIDDNEEDFKNVKRSRLNICYKEPAVNRKLTKSDPTVDRRFYISPHRKGKRKRTRVKVAPIALKDIISIVEQSFHASFLL